MKAIIFGAKGQDGHYLSELLHQQRVQVIGVSPEGEGYIHGNVSDFEFVKNLIEDYKPDYIFDFAAISSTSHDFLFKNHKTIGTGTLNILESVRLYCPHAKVFLSGSAMQFENTEGPIREDTPFEASSPYATARIYSVYMGRYYRTKFSMDVYVGYFFNHDSPLRTEQHINKRIVDAIKRISQGSDEKIEIGDLDAKKEFNFAGDVVMAVWLLVNQKSIYEVVIGSGEVHSIKEFVEYCFKKIHKNWQDYVVIKPHFIAEYQILISDPKLIQSLGWKSKLNFEQLADLMMGDTLS